MKLYVGNLAFATSSQNLQELFAGADTAESAAIGKSRLRDRSEEGHILRGEVVEVRGEAFVDDEEAYKQVRPYFTQIAESRKRARKVQTQIDRLKKKTQAIIDRLP
jgi:hypothetical protein